MAVRSGMQPLVNLVGQIVDDSTNTHFNAETDVQRALDDHRTLINGVPLRRDVTRKVFLPDSSVYWKLAYFDENAVLNTSQDQSGTLKTADIIDYLAGRFTFTTADDSNVFLYIFGDAYNPGFAAAALLDRHPNPEDPSQLSQLRVMQYSITFAGRNMKSKADKLRDEWRWVNRAVAGHLNETIVDPYERRFA